jgi:hypothetical protein
MYVINPSDAVCTKSAPSNLSNVLRLMSQSVKFDRRSMFFLRRILRTDRTLGAGPARHVAHHNRVDLIAFLARSSRDALAARSRAHDVRVRRHGAPRANRAHVIDLLRQSRVRWLKNTEVCDILLNYRQYEFGLSTTAPITPPGA